MAEFTPEDFYKKGITVNTRHKVLSVDGDFMTLKDIGTGAKVTIAYFSMTDAEEDGHEPA